MPALSTTASVFRQLFQAELGYVWGSLRRLGVNDRDVEDVAHDVFVQVYKKFDAYDHERPLRPWLFGFAFRAASDYRRLARHRVEVMAADDNASSSSSSSVAMTPADAEDVIERSQEQALVVRALESIDLERRAVLVAFELDEQPMKEIAASLEIPLHTAYSRLRVAREELKAAIQRERARTAERRRA